MPSIATAVERANDTGLALAEAAQAEPETVGREITDPLTSVVPSHGSAPSRSKRDATSGSQERQRADAPKTRRAGPSLARAKVKRDRMAPQDEQPRPILSQVPVIGLFAQ